MKAENHIRGLALALKTNPMTIARRVDEFCKDNILDFRQQGKNKVFFVKKTLEAKQFAYIVEANKILVLLDKYPALRRVIEEIRKDRRIRLAILFGSYAKDRAGRDSDIDIYIDTIDRRVKEQAESIDSRISVKIGAYNKDSLLIKEIEKDSIIIKGVETYYEKNKFLD